MKKDTKKTRVMFYMETEENSNPTPIAIFLGEEQRFYPAHVCYSHIGQHSAAHPTYFEKLPKATPEQYKELAEELESIGYNLTIQNKPQ